MNEIEKLNAIIDSYQPRLQALKDENFELKESLKCFQKPEVVKVLTDYRTGEIDNLRQENERLKAEITELEEKFLTLNGKSYSYYKTLQEIKGIATALYMNEWLQRNETAKQSIQLLQDKISEV